jgi:hypothetical protein
MSTITLTTEQYNAIRQLKHFAQWYVDEHEGSFGGKEAIEQWESDRDEVARGIATLDQIDQDTQSQEAK